MADRTPDPTTNQRPAPTLCPTPNYDAIRRESGIETETAIRNIIITLNSFILRKGP